MNRDERLDDLLLDWEDQLAAGRDLSAEELCRDCPELIADCAARLQVLRRMRGLAGAVAPGRSSDLTSKPGGFGETLGPSGAAAPAPPPAIPGYVIEGELGRGGMGVVYRARQLSLDRTVALKMILAGPHADADSLMRFVQEAQMIGRLKHGHIVQVYECGSHDGRPYFSLELMEGGTLAARLRGEPQPARAAAELVATIAAAVEAAHALGIVHRDLKPANVLLAADGTPKVADFGLARDVDSGATASGSVLGTPSYMAPEQARGERAGKPADIYALGAILYELLTGRPPFRGASAWDTVQLVVSTEPVAPRQLQPKAPRDLETICLKCLEKDPRKRYASARELADDLARFLDDRPVLAKPVGPAERLWRAACRRPMVASLAVLLTAALLGGTILSTLLWRRAEGQRETAEGEWQRAEANAVAARREKERAELQEQAARAEATRANDTVRFLTDMFKAADPVGLGELSPLRPRAGDGLRTIDALNRGVELLRTHSGADPAVRAEIMDTLGGLYCILGDPQKAQPLLEASLAHRRAGADRVRLSETLHNLGWMYHQLGDLSKARKFYEEALALRRERAAEDPLNLSTTMLTYAWMLTDAEEQVRAEKLFVEAVALREKHLGDARGTAVAKLALVGNLLDQGKNSDAVKPYSEAVATLRKTDGTGGLAEAISLFQQALIARSGPLPALATGPLRKSLQITRGVFGGEHPFVAFIEHELAVTLVAIKDNKGAEQHFREALRIATPFGLDHPRSRVVVTAFARLLADTGRRAAACELLDLALTHARRPGREPNRAADLLVVYADLFDRPEDAVRQEKLLREALALYQSRPDAPRYHESACLTMLAPFLSGPEAYDLAAWLAGRIKAFDPKSTHRVEIDAAVVTLLKRAKARGLSVGAAANDPRFDPVRARKDFARLMAPGKPTPKPPD